MRHIENELIENVNINKELCLWKDVLDLGSARRAAPRFFFRLTVNIMPVHLKITTILLYFFRSIRWRCPFSSIYARRGLQPLPNSH